MLFPTFWLILDRVVFRIFRPRGYGSPNQALEDLRRRMSVGDSKGALLVAKTIDRQMDRQREGWPSITDI